MAEINILLQLIKFFFFFSFSLIKVESIVEKL